MREIHELMALNLQLTELSCYELLISHIQERPMANKSNVPFYGKICEPPVRAALCGLCIMPYLCQLINEIKIDFSSLRSWILRLESQFLKWNNDYVTFLYIKTPYLSRGFSSCRFYYWIKSFYDEKNQQRINLICME